MSKIKYNCPKEIKYYSERYRKWVTIPEGYPSDGATFAEDIYSDSWWVHDGLCDVGKWDDGTPCTNWQASMVLRDILIAEKRYIRSTRWFVATFLFGGGEARKNGMFRLKPSRAVLNPIPRELPAAGKGRPSDKYIKTS